MPPQKRKHPRTTNKSWQNNPEKPSEVNRQSARKTDPARAEKDSATFREHPKNEQGQNICYAEKSNGLHCQLPAGQRTDHEGWGRCSFHGGNTPTLRTNAARYMGGEIIDRMTNSYGYGGPIDLDPHEALLQEVRRAGGHVAWIADRINFWQLVEGQGKDQKLRALTAVEQEWLELYHKERILLTKVAKTALDAGVAEERVRLAREQGMNLVGALNQIFDALGLTVEQRRLIPQVVPRVLRELTQPQSVMQIEQPPMRDGV